MLTPLPGEDLKAVRLHELSQTPLREDRDVTAPAQVGPLRPGNLGRVRVGVAGEQQHDTTGAQMPLKRFHKTMRINYVLNHVKC